MARVGFDRGDLMAIAGGGIVGASLRWLVARDASTTTDDGWFSYGVGTSGTIDSALPVDTLVVNLLGCLALGALTLLLARSVPVSRRLLVAAATGFCGSLTTFSTFAVEVAERLRAGPALSPQVEGLSARFERDLSDVFVYVALSIAGGAIAFWMGRFVANRLVSTPNHHPSRGST